MNTRTDGTVDDNEVLTIDCYKDETYHLVFYDDLAKHIKTDMLNQKEGFYDSEKA